MRNASANRSRVAGIGAGAEPPLVWFRESLDCARFQVIVDLPGLPLHDLFISGIFCGKSNQARLAGS